MMLLRKLLSRVAILLMLAVLPFCLVKAQGNVNSNYIPNVIPPTPNASALMKFTDVPVSTYTGTADVTVPIYTIEARGITVPISLAYHTGGIRLKEEASWVGLGWALNAGGIISRTIMGHDDFGSDGVFYLTNQVPQLPGDFSATQPPQAGGAISNYFFDFYCSYKVNTAAGTEDLTNAFNAGGDTYDMEPDIFSYNFPGHSGKFILTRAGNVIMQKQENIKIQYQGTGNQVTFSITDDQGNKFYFNVLEETAISPKPQQISSWMLSKIVTQQQDSVIFTYASGGSTTSMAADISQTYANYCTAVTGFTTTNSNPPVYYNQTLQSIDFTGGHLQFGFDANRTDLTGGYELDSIMIYSKNAAGAQTFVKQDNFYYSYFNSTYSTSNYAEYYRLKLDSVKEKSGGYSQPAYSFVYNNPNPGSTSAKHSFNVDHWGYFNGMSNSILIPSMDVVFDPANNPMGNTQFLTYAGGNRQPNLTYMQDFSLQQINYPTGGKTVLAYQANDYDYNNSVAGSVDPFTFVQTTSLDSEIVATHKGFTTGTINLNNIYPIIPSGSAGTNVTVTFGFRYLTNNNSTYANTTGKIYFNIAGIDQDIDGATCIPNTSVCTASASVILSPGVYSWTAYIDGSIDTATIFQGIYVDVQYQETQQVYNQLQYGNYVMPAAGLRIQSITNYKDASTIASEKTYSYTYSQDKLGTGYLQQYSYGRLMSMPCYGRYAITTTSSGGNCTALYLFSSSIIPQTSACQGNIVGYDQVTEYNINPATGQDIGKTVYNYYNSADTAISFVGYRMPGLANMGNNLNGTLLSKVNYANNGGQYFKVDETDYTYHTANRTVYFSPKYQYFQGVMNGALCAGGITVGIQTFAWFYPSIKSERVLLDVTKNIFYQQGDPTQTVTNSTSDYYDNTVHYQLTRALNVDSKGDTLITLLKYPQDYIPNGNQVTGNTILDSLIGRNMVSKTIEHRDSLYYLGSSSGYITGAQLNLYKILSGNHNTIVPDRTYKLDIQSPITNFTPFSINGNITSMDNRNRQMVSFDQYDASNNIQQYTPTDQNSVTIIWDYINKYPIAQVKNAALADIAATSFEADGKGGWTFSGTPVSDASSPTGSLCYGLSSGNIIKSGLTSGTTYIVSYWSKTGASYSVTGSSAVKQGKTINGWTYFEHTVSGITTETVSGSGSIDELRIYPSTAQMKTYTYSPLNGVTTECDAGNKINYYFYDGLGRLKWIKDQDGNMVKTFQYHYLGGTTQF